MNVRRWGFFGALLGVAAFAGGDDMQLDSIPDEQQDVIEEQQDVIEEEQDVREEEAELRDAEAQQDADGCEALDPTHGCTSW